MNYERLKASMGFNVRLVPPCSARSAGEGARSIDDEWRIDSVDREFGIRLTNLRTDHVLTLNADHVHHFTTAQKATDGVKRGFLELTVYVELSGDKASISPIATGPARAARSTEGTKEPRRGITQLLTEKGVGLMLQFIDTRAHARGVIERLQEDAFSAMYSGDPELVLSTVSNLRRIAEQFSLVLPDLYEAAIKQVEQLELVSDKIRKDRYTVAFVGMKKADEQYAGLQKQMQRLIAEARDE